MSQKNLHALMEVEYMFQPGSFHELRNLMDGK